MNIKPDLHYTRDHEWLRIDGGEAVVGITDYAQGELGDIVFLDLPELGTDVIMGKPFGTIEAVKAAADLFAPVSGEVVAVNGLLDQSPELINKSAYEDGWIVRIRMSDPSEVETLMDSTEYRKMLEDSKGT